MTKKYEIDLSGLDIERPIVLHKDQTWIISLSEYRKITKITRRKDSLTISYIDRNDTVETEGRMPLKEFVLWILDSGARLLEITYKVI